ncbi:Serine/threonine-protein kinase stk11 [Borealophlyctis nickersoniae]|nr:Serine/threonine-protein kinase stk11 [Borealophlyctis nickersoniae]
MAPDKGGTAQESSPKHLRSSPSIPSALRVASLSLLTAKPDKRGGSMALPLEPLKARMPADSLPTFPHPPHQSPPSDVSPRRASRRVAPESAGVGMSVPTVHEPSSSLVSNTGSNASTLQHPHQGWSGTTVVAASQHSSDIRVEKGQVRMISMPAFPPYPYGGIGTAVEEMGGSMVDFPKSAPDVNQGGGDTGGGVRGSAEVGSAAGGSGDVGSRGSSLIDASVTMSMGAIGAAVPPSRSANSSRRTTVSFQGRNALVAAQQRKMSAVDVSPGGSVSGSLVSGSLQEAMQMGTDEAGNWIGGGSFSMGSVEKPTLLIFPRKSIVTPSRSMVSMQNLATSRSGSIVTGLAAGSASRSGSLVMPNYSRTGSVTQSRTGSGALANQSRTGSIPMGNQSQMGSTALSNQGGSISRLVLTGSGALGGSVPNSIGRVSPLRLSVTGALIEKGSRGGLSSTSSLGRDASKGSRRKVADDSQEAVTSPQPSSLPSSLPSSFPRPSPPVKGKTPDISDSAEQEFDDAQSDQALDDFRRSLESLHDPSRISHTSPPPPVNPRLSSVRADALTSQNATTTTTLSSRPISTVGPIDDSYRNNPEYYEYLMLCQRHSSSNFIHKIDSSEVVWKATSATVKMIGPYLLGEQIGKGSFGKVKEGLCSETLQRVAVKIINKKRLRKVQNGVEGVIREIKLLRRLKHRNIITLIDVYSKVEDPTTSEAGIFNWFTSIEDEPIVWQYDDGSEAERNVEILKWYLVFEYCPCSLQTLLEQAEGGKVDIARGHRYFVQLIEGLNYLHSQSVIHRDIKPGNMLITPDGVLKIADFGIAEQFSPYDAVAMETGAFAGTHQFLAPEIAEGAAQFLGEKGRYPFEFDEDGSILVLYEKIIAGKFNMPTEFDADLKDLLNGKYYCVGLVLVFRLWGFVLPSGLEQKD